MTFHAQAIPFRRQRIGWRYSTTRDGVEHRFQVRVVLYPDGEIIADAFPVEPEGAEFPVFTFRATAMRRSDANGKVHYVLVWNGNEIASRSRLTTLLEISGNQAIAMANAALDEAYIKARDLAMDPIARCPTCQDIRQNHGGFGPPHYQRAKCQSARPTEHCSCSVCF
jgi:hypothetical protein